MVRIEATGRLAEANERLPRGERRGRGLLTSRCPALNLSQLCGFFSIGIIGG